MEVNASSNVITTMNSAFQLLVPKQQKTDSSMNSTSCIQKSTTGNNVNKSLELSGGNEILPTHGTTKPIPGSLETTLEDWGQGDTKNNEDKTNCVSAKLNDNRSAVSYSTSAILVPVISSTSGRNILEEMKRKAAHTLLHQQKLPTASTQNSKSSLVPGTNVEYRTPGANHKNKNGRIKRPMNAFMVWARDCRSHLATSMPNATNSEISVRLGQIWAAMKPDDKRKYYDIAEKIKAKHRKDYPDWVYQPNAPGMKKKEEVLNYGRTPTPPLNYQHRDGVPASSETTSSNATGTQQTTIVVLSNDNKIHHTKLTTSQSLLLQNNPTTSPLSVSRTLTGSPGKVVPAAVPSINMYQSQLEKLGVVSTKEMDNTNKLTLPVYRSLSNSPRNIKTPVDLSKVQYQSAMEAPEVNKVTEKTKDLLATKIISARPFDHVTSRMNQAIRQFNGESEERTPRSSERERHTNVPKTLRAHAQNKPDEQPNTSGNDRKSAQQITKGCSSLATLTTMARQNDTTIKQTKSSENNGSGHLQVTSAIPVNSRSEYNQFVEPKQINESTNTISSVATTEGSKQISTSMASGFKSQQPQFTNVQLTNVPCRNRPMLMTPVNRAPFNFGRMNFRTPNIRPVLAGMMRGTTVRPVLAGMMRGTTSNIVRQGIPKLRPKVPIISNPFNIPVAESWIGPTSTPVRLMTSHRDAQNPPPNTKPSAVSMTTGELMSSHRGAQNPSSNIKPSAVSMTTAGELMTSHRHGQNQQSNTKTSAVSMTSVQEENKEKYPSTNIEDMIKPVLDVSHRTEDVTDNTPTMPIFVPQSTCVEETVIKKEDELWPFSFSDNPGDWSNEDIDHHMYVEMIDPYDPFLTPGDMLSEMYPGSLTLDMDSWNDYMVTKPDEPTDFLESCFLDTTDDITISPVPLRKTLNRLINAETQVSNTCDVISGDLITQGDEPYCDLIQDPKTAILTDDLARTLSGIMRCVVSGNDKSNETDSETHAQNADDNKSGHVDSNVTSLVEKCHVSTEVVINDATSKLPNDTDGEHAAEAQKNAPAGTENISTDNGSSVNRSNFENNNFSKSSSESSTDKDIPSTSDVAVDTTRRSFHKLKQNKQTPTRVNITPRRSTRSRTVKAT